MKVRFSHDQNDKKRITQLIKESYDGAPSKREFQYHSQPKAPQIFAHDIFMNECTTIDTVPNHQRSKSHEQDYLSKVQNTFGLESQKTLAKNSIRNRNYSYSQKENDPGFLSPKFKFMENQILNEIQDCVTEQSMQSSQIYQTRLQQKDQIIDELQKQLQGLLKNIQVEINHVRQEAGRMIQSQEKQIDIYQKQIKDYREQIQILQNDVKKFKARERELLTRCTKKDELIMVSSVPKYKDCNCLQLKKENEALLTKVDQLMHQLTDFRSIYEMNNMSINNQISVIENRQCDLTQFEKTFKWLADELNLSIEGKNINQSFSVINQDILEGVKSLKNLNKENQKFVKCLKDLVIQCAPNRYFESNDPPLKEVWKFIKKILSTYLENKRSSTQHEEIIEMLCKYLICEKQELCHKTACLVVDQDIYNRILDKVKILFQINQNANVREIDKCLERYLQ